MRVFHLGDNCICTQVMNEAEAMEADNGDDAEKTEGAAADESAAANGETAKTHKKKKESLEQVDKAVASRIKEAQNVEEASKKFGAVFERLEESAQKVSNAALARDGFVL